MFLAIDLGSTHFKAGVFDAALQLRGIGIERLHYQYGSGSIIELAADEVERGVRQVIALALAEAGLPAERLAAVAITSQAQTFTVVNSQGQARMEFISWQDGRAQEACQELAAEPMLTDFAAHCSFGALLPALQISQLRHLHAARPGFIAPDDQVLKLPSYLVRQLTGTAAIDNNLAAMSGLYSLSSEGWWPAALAACGLQAAQLPELRPIGSFAGRTGLGAQLYGLPVGLPVVLAGNDQTAGAYGSQIHKNGALLLTLGTAQVAYACVPRRLPATSASITGPYPQGRSYKMGADDCGGNMVNWATTILNRCFGFDDFFALVQQAPPGCQGLVFRPELTTGNGAWDHIGLDHSPAHFARAVLESLVERMAAMVHALDFDCRTMPVLAAGGGSRQSIWVNMLAERLDVPVTAVVTDPLLGAARMAHDALAD